jgi:hypothetical protein
MVKDSPGRGSRSFIYGSFMRVRRTVLAQPLLRVKESCTAAVGFANSAAHLNFGRLASLGTSGWKGSLSAEGVKSSVQLPPKDAPLVPVGPFLSILAYRCRGCPNCMWEHSSRSGMAFPRRLTAIKHPIPPREVIQVNRPACRFARYKSPRRPHPPPSARPIESPYAGPFLGPGQRGRNGLPRRRRFWL